MTGGTDPVAFRAGRARGWEELGALVRRARGRRVRDLTTTEIERLGTLYRRAASDLARARRDLPGEAVTAELNDLVAAAHPLLRRGRPFRPASVGGYLLTGVPRAVRAASGYVLVSLALSLLGVVAGWLAVDLRPDLASSLAPQTSLFDRMARGEIPVGTDVGLDTAIGIILNNMRVALIACAGGVLLGLPTVYITLANGWMLGTLGAMEHRDGLDVTFWSFIAPHGVIELSIFVIAGATGLMIADAILRPGLLRRTDALTARGSAAGPLVVALACVLITCGLIEGLFSPTGAPEGLKYAVGALTGVLLYGWLLGAGRSRRRRENPLAASFAADAPGAAGSAL